MYPRRDASYSTIPQKNYTIANTRLPMMAWRRLLFQLNSFRCTRGAVTVPLTGRNLWKFGVAGACPRLCQSRSDLGRTLECTNFSPLSPSIIL